MTNKSSNPSSASAGPDDGRSKKKYFHNERHSHKILDKTIVRGGFQEVDWWSRHEQPGRHRRRTDGEEVRPNMMSQPVKM